METFKQLDDLYKLIEEQHKLILTLKIGVEMDTDLFREDLINAANNIWKAYSQLSKEEFPITELERI